jgi:hypothetical protein
MPFFQNAALNQQLKEAVEAADAHSAMRLLQEHDTELSDKAPLYLCEVFEESNWLEFWEQILKNTDKNYSSLINKTLKLSQEKGLTAFLFSALKYPAHLEAIENYAIDILIKDYQKKVPYIKELFQKLGTQRPAISNQFFSLLIKKTFWRGQSTILNLLYQNLSPSDIAQSLASLPLDKFQDIAKRLVLKKINKEIIFSLIEHLPAPEIKKSFCKEIIMTCIEENNQELLHELFEKQESTDFLTIFSELSPSEKKLVCFYLVTHEPTDTPFIRELLTQLNSQEFYNQLVLESFNRYNIMLFKNLSTLCPPFNFEEAIQTCDKKKLQQYFRMEANRAQFIHSKMNPFAKGYGHIRYEDALLTLAQRRARKTYPFEAVVIRDRELDDFLSFLVSGPKPIETSFVISGGHYVAGKVAIDRNGQAKIFIIDSLGPEIWHHDFLTNFAQQFPQHEIYIAKEKRQNSNKGCSVFALDDVAHLATLRIEGHLNLWDYLSSEKKSENLSDTPIQHYCAPLPLSLTRTMQSTSLLRNVIPEKSESAQKFKINKKGQTTEESVTPFFQKTSPDDPKPKNTRIDYKLFQMTEQNWAFLVNYPVSEVLQAMEYFTLDAWKKRLVSPSESAQDTVDGSDQSIQENLITKLFDLKEQYRENGNAYLLSVEIQKIIIQYATFIAKTPQWKDVFIQLVDETLTLINKETRKSTTTTSFFYSPEPEAEKLQSIKEQLEHGEVPIIKI